MCHLRPSEFRYYQEEVESSEGQHIPERLPTLDIYLNLASSAVDSVVIHRQSTVRYTQSLTPRPQYYPISPVESLVSHPEASNPLVGQIDFLVTSIHIASARGAPKRPTRTTNRQEPRDRPPTLN